MPSSRRRLTPPPQLPLPPPSSTPPSSPIAKTAAVTTTTNRKPAVCKITRQLVWNRWIGARNGIGYCWCCRSTIISTFDFEAGHVQAQSKGGGDNVDNLRPICAGCNRSMGTENMYDFQKRNGFIAAQSTFARFVDWVGSWTRGWV